MYFFLTRLFHNCRFSKYQGYKIKFKKITQVATAEISKIRESETNRVCAAGFALLNLPKGKSLGRSKPATNSSNEQAH